MQSLIVVADNEIPLSFLLSPINIINFTQAALAGAHNHKMYDRC